MEIINLFGLAIATGAATGLHNTANLVIKDAYEALRQYIQFKYDKVNLELLETQPDSDEERSVLEYELKKYDADKDLELIRLSNKMIEVVRLREPDTYKSIGVRLKDVDLAILSVKKILVGRGIGIDIDGGEVDNIEIGTLHVNKENGGGNSPKG